MISGWPMKTGRVIFTGSRDWADEETIDDWLTDLSFIYPEDLVVVHGACATGADEIVERLCQIHGITTEPHPAEWLKHGRAAGPIRNRRMVDLGADLVIGFPLGASRGTRGCMRLARAADIPVIDATEE